MNFKVLKTLMRIELVVLHGLSFLHILCDLHFSILSLGQL